MNTIYCPRCKKHTKNENPTSSQTTNERTLISAYCVVC